MILSQLGFILLSCALGMTLTALFRRQNSDLMVLTRFSCLLILLAFLCLMFCFLRNDFNVLYVLRNSSTLLPWYYRRSVCYPYGHWL
jgi:cytochrome c biogenesis factor